MWIEYLRIARKVLAAHKFRSTLTVLSITIGAFSIVLMSSLAESGTTTLFRGIEEMGGGRIIMVWPKPSERAERKAASYTRGLTREDRDVLYENLPHVASRSAWTNLRRKEVIADNGRIVRTDVVTGDGGVFEGMGARIDRGRLFSEEENRRHAKTCVVGAKLAERLYDGEAIGHTVLVAGARCRVVGQLSARTDPGSDFGVDRLDVIYVPLELAAEADPTIKSRAGLLLKTTDQKYNDIVKRILNAILSERHHGLDDFQIFDFSGVMDKFTGVFRTMEIIVAFLAGIALLVGGVGVMNMMLVSVSERVREIGIRKALGANPKDIGRQFLLEAVVLAGTGGFIGVLAGISMSLASALVIRHFYATWVTRVAYGAVTSALLVSVSVGIIFGYVPALRASRLDAVEAMRH